jgi:pimeloyl-ACP methyl ester carboxylesterase
MLKFMATGGLFLQHRRLWDDNGDGKISAEEFEKDSKGVRRKSLPGVELKAFDADGSGDYTLHDRELLGKELLAAIDRNDFDIIDGFLKQAATVPIPKNWARDQFAHPPMFDVITRLKMPVGFFHGEDDGNTPVESMRELERRVKASGHPNVEFHYFEGLGHGLGSTDYFSRGVPSSGYVSIFDFVKRHTARR